MTEIGIVTRAERAEGLLRDTESLVRAARLAVQELAYAPSGESKRDASCRIKTKWQLEGALKPFAGTAE